jgi:hypothetical protein
VWNLLFPFANLTCGLTAQKKKKEEGKVEIKYKKIDKQSKNDLDVDARWLDSKSRNTFFFTEIACGTFLRFYGFFSFFFFFII